MRLILSYHPLSQGGAVAHKSPFFAHQSPFLIQPLFTLFHPELSNLAW